MHVLLNHALRKVSSGKYVRLRSPDAIIREIQEIAEANPDKREFYLEVETITTNITWALELCSKLEKLNNEREFPLRYGANLRIAPNTNFELLFTAMKASNFRFLNIGVESGSEKIRREVLKRNYSNDDIIRTTALAKNFGFAVTFYNMLGFPDETEQDFHDTIELNRICAPSMLSTSIFFPYPGTELYSLLEKKGLNKPEEPERY